jgi:hypothetical protein
MNANLQARLTNKFYYYSEETALSGTGRAPSKQPREAEDLIYFGRGVAGSGAAQRRF